MKFVYKQIIFQIFLCNNKNISYTLYLLYICGHFLRRIILLAYFYYVLFWHLRGRDDEEAAYINQNRDGDCGLPQSPRILSAASVEAGTASVQIQGES